ncbi:MAG: hypothetical protein KAS21_05345 [Candidatus Aminicenantes bacterium]|nr:hypothetical protein [Candidatus Aminicenantes bacterium]
MKKSITFVTVFLMVIAIPAATGIHVDKPGNGFTIYHGGNNGYMIKWTVSGEIGPKVKIRLFNKTGTIKIYNITDSTNTITSGTTGQFLWKQNLINNTDIGEYVILVKTKDNNYYDESGVFHVKKKNLSLIAVNPKLSKKPVIGYAIKFTKIIISKPVNNATYQIYKPIEIRWDKNFGDYEWVWIYVYYIGNSNPVAIIGTNMKNTGVSSWTPSSIYNTFDIFVEIKTSDGKYSGKSGMFKISEPAVEAQ